MNKRCIAGLAACWLALIVTSSTRSFAGNSTAAAYDNLLKEVNRFAEPPMDKNALGVDSVRSEIFAMAKTGDPVCLSLAQRLAKILVSNGTACEDPSLKIVRALKADDITELSVARSAKAAAHVVDTLREAPGNVPGHIDPHILKPLMMELCVGAPSVLTRISASELVLNAFERCHNESGETGPVLVQSSEAQTAVNGVIEGLLNPLGDHAPLDRAAALRVCTAYDFFGLLVELRAGQLENPTLKAIDALFVNTQKTLASVLKDNADDAASDAVKTIQKHLTASQAAAGQLREKLIPIAQLRPFAKKLMAAINAEDRDQLAQIVTPKRLQMIKKGQSLRDLFAGMKGIEEINLIDIASARIEPPVTVHINVYLKNAAGDLLYRQVELDLVKSEQAWILGPLN